MLFHISLSQLRPEILDMAINILYVDFLFRHAPPPSEVHTYQWVDSYGFDDFVFPTFAIPVRGTSSGVCGIALTRKGDIL